MTRGPIIATALAIAIVLAAPIPASAQAQGQDPHHPEPGAGSVAEPATGTPQQGMPQPGADPGMAGPGMMGMMPQGMMPGAMMGGMTGMGEMPGGMTMCPMMARMMAMHSGMMPMMSGKTGPQTMGPGTMTGPGTPDLASGVVTPSRHLSVDDVRHFLDHRLDQHGNDRLKVGDVRESDEDTIVAEIATVDGSLVDRLSVDRHTGVMRRAP